VTVARLAGRVAGGSTGSAGFGSLFFGRRDGLLLVKALAGGRWSGPRRLRSLAPGASAHRFAAGWAWL